MPKTGKPIRKRDRHGDTLCVEGAAIWQQGDRNSGLIAYACPSLKDPCKHAKSWPALVLVLKSLSGDRRPEVLGLIHARRRGPGRGSMRHECPLAAPDLFVWPRMDPGPARRFGYVHSQWVYKLKR